jgi:hypothetical protein
MQIDRVWTSLLDIRNRTARDPEYAGETHRDPAAAIRLAPHVTLIRGDNGSGKTVVAEVVSLVGHLSILSEKPVSERQGTPFATVQLRLSDSDIAFLAWLKTFKASPSAGSVTLGERQWNLSRDAERQFRSAFSDFEVDFEIPTANEAIFLEFWRKVPSRADRERDQSQRSSHFDIKRLLASDHLLAEHVAFRASSHNHRSLAGAIQHLIAWSRPRLTGKKSESGPWTLSPRFILSQMSRVKGEPLNPDLADHLEGVYPPGPIGYINTDMYDFGAGLDIRESPKELREHMTRTLVDRLQVVDNIRDASRPAPSNRIKNSGDEFPIMRLPQVQAGWEHLFGDNHELKTQKAYSRNGDLHWCEEEYLQEFVSSGENQAFFLLCYLENLHWNGSILVLDEPEIHLSIRAASRLISKIIEYAHKRQTQIIIVTHLPHLYYSAAVGNYEYDLIYLKRIGGAAKQVNVLEGSEAFKAASMDSHIEAHNVVEDLRSDDSPDILFWKDGFKRWSSWGAIGLLILVYAFLSNNPEFADSRLAIISVHQLKLAPQFLIPSVLMGLGIAIDVAIATVSRFRDRSMSFANWTLPVAIAHILLPAIGYYGWWFLGQQFHELTLVLGIIAFGMIAVFIYEAICEWVDAKPLISLEPITDWSFKHLGSESKGRVIMVFAVSMDALWSGPAKAAQAASGQWTPFEVFISFFIAGAVVALVAELALLIAFALRRVSFNNTNRLAHFLVGGKYLEVTILFAFGLLSLWNAFAAWIGLGTLNQCIAASAAFMLVIWIVFWRRLVREQLTELESVEAEA